MPKCRRGTEQRNCATGYDKPSDRYEATVLVAAVNEWL